MRYLLFYISPSEFFSPVKLKIVSMILFERASLYKHSNKIYSKNSMSTKFDGKFSENIEMTSISTTIYSLFVKKKADIIIPGGDKQGVFYISPSE